MKLWTRPIYAQLLVLPSAAESFSFSAQMQTSSFHEPLLWHKQHVIMLE